MKKYFSLILLSLFFVHCGPSARLIYEDAVKDFSSDLLGGKIIANIPASAKLQDIRIDESRKKITLIYDKNLSFIPFREESVNKIYDELRLRVSSDYEYSVETLDQPIENLIPNYYRKTTPTDLSRKPLEDKGGNVVTRIYDNNFAAGLKGRNIVLWHSHGWYYSNSQKRWEWQRPRLFQAVEDLIPLSFTVPFLIPMLENAGANVFVPRERDFQKNEVIVDNTDQSYTESSLSLTARYGPQGFGHFSEIISGNELKNPLTTGVNPFRLGNTRYFTTDNQISAHAQWVPDIPETGNYAVYISYASSENSAEDVLYTVHYYGGSRDFIVDQRKGGSTWIYLGNFKFRKGMNEDNGKVMVFNKSSKPGCVVSMDAVRFGGGMGVVERGGSTSGRAKFFEGARYWLQFAGMPDTLVYNLNHDTLDYNDDYQSRGEYANYLKGNPSGPNRKRDEKGAGINIDLSLAFHTDAGITYNDTVVGTLAIYTLDGADSLKVFPDSVSRFANRDLSDIVQTQIVDDITGLFDPAWTRRQLREAQYSESFRPNVPAMLLELLSHQNFLDMQYVHDPRFRFAVARAIYKGMLKFLSEQYNYDYVVQPLPVDHFSVEFSGINTVGIKWKPQSDELEPSAVPENFILYTRIDDQDFNSGEIVSGNSVVKEIKPGHIYSFKVTAINRGGESFPSEILSAGVPVTSKGDILIVNGFDRICGPAKISSNEYSGFMNDIDDGVPYKYDFLFTGRQYDYKVSSPFISNDSPGHGASSSEYETSVIAGNSFDYPYVHGKSLLANGFTFASMSDESFESTGNLKHYSMIDYILGEEKETSWQKSIMDSIKGKQFKAFTPGVIKAISDYLDSGGNIFISGSYLGSELYSDSAVSQFAIEKLKIRNSASHASRTGQVKTLPVLNTNVDLFYFNTELNDSLYAVNSPGSINHTGEGDVLMRYAENQFSAGVGYKNKYGITAFGFPFETITDDSIRNELMKSVLNYLGL